MSAIRRISVIALVLTCWVGSAYCGSRDVIHGSVAVNAGSYHWESLEIPAVGVQLPGLRFKGHLQASGGSGNDIEVYVMNETEFTNFKNGHETETYFSSQRATAIDVQVPITDSGTYYIVLDNRFSAFTPKTVTGEVNLEWTDPPVEDASAKPPGVLSNYPRTTAMVTGMAVAGLGATAIAWAISKQKKKQS